MGANMNRVAIAIAFCAAGVLATSTQGGEDANQHLVVTRKRAFESRALESHQKGLPGEAYLVDTFDLSHPASTLSISSSLHNSDDLWSEQASSVCSSGLDADECHNYQLMMQQLGVNSTTDPCQNTYDPTEADNQNTFIEIDDFSTSCSSPDSHGVRHLTMLNVANMGLVGSLPVEIGSFPYLVALNVAQNSQLRGPLPSSIGNLGSLVKVAGYMTCLSGEIPKEIGQCTQLKEFRVGLNKLSGVIPEEFARLPNLHHVSLAYTDLSGAPDSLFSNPA